jgi:ribosome maturation factor RimP
MKEKIFDILANFDTPINLYVLEINVNRNRIEVIADTDTGLLLTDCVSISRHIKKSLEMQEINVDDFFIDVCSPGIDYAIKESWQLKKNVGRKVQIKQKDSKLVNGKIVMVENQNFAIKTNKGKLLSYNLTDINEIKIQI